jgi:hypothetical protein
VRASLTQAEIERMAELHYATLLAGDEEERREETATPWELEKHLLSSGLRLPLNVDGNPSQEAVAIVSAVRLKARQVADELDIIIDSGGPRRLPKH